VRVKKRSKERGKFSSTVRKRVLMAKILAPRKGGEEKKTTSGGISKKRGGGNSV